MTALHDYEEMQTNIVRLYVETMLPTQVGLLIGAELPMQLYLWREE